MDCITRSKDVSDKFIATHQEYEHKADLRVGNGIALAHSGRSGLFRPDAQLGLGLKWIFWTFNAYHFVIIFKVEKCNTKATSTNSILHCFIPRAYNWLCVLQALNGGIVMVNFYSMFITCNQSSTLQDVIGKCLSNRDCIRKGDSVMEREEVSKTTWMREISVIWQYRQKQNVADVINRPCIYWQLS